MWLKNEKGFYMAELIMSLSGWLLISGVLVPIFIQVNKQSIEIQEKSEALHILYEYMQTVTIENPVKENKILTRDHTHYEIVWEMEQEDGKSEVSIRYEDVFGHKIQIYESIQ
jgi:Tfp pilus assembly protein PilE